MVPRLLPEAETSHEVKLQRSQIYDTCESPALKDTEQLPCYLHYCNSAAKLLGVSLI